MRKFIAEATMATGLLLSGCAGEQPESLPPSTTIPNIECGQAPKDTDQALISACEIVAAEGYEDYYPLIEFALENVNVHKNELPAGPQVNSKAVSILLLDKAHSQAQPKDNSYSVKNSAAFYERDSRLIRIFNTDQLNPQAVQTVMLHELEHAYRHSLSNFEPVDTGAPTDKAVVASLTEEVEVMSTTFDFMNTIYGNDYADFINRTAESTQETGGQLPEIKQDQLEKILGRSLSTDDFNYYKNAVQMASVFKAYDRIYGTNSQESLNWKVRFLAGQIGRE